MTHAKQKSLDFAIGYLGKLKQTTLKSVHFFPTGPQYLSNCTRLLDNDFLIHIKGMIIRVVWTSTTNGVTMYSLQIQEKMHAVWDSTATIL